MMLITNAYQLDDSMARVDFPRHLHAWLKRNLLSRGRHRDSVEKYCPNFRGGDFPALTTRRPAGGFARVVF